MNEFETLEDRFRTGLGQFLLAVQTARAVDAVAFQKIDRDAAEIARALKDHSLIPKALLNELRVATKILRAEAPYVEGGKNELGRMADKLEMTFDLILKGECPEDRVPGKPRII